MPSVRNKKIDHYNSGGKGVQSFRDKPRFAQARFYGKCEYSHIYFKSSVPLLGSSRWEDDFEEL